VRFAVLAAVLCDHGFEQRGGKGSHVVFKHPGAGVSLAIPDPGRGYVDPVYVRQALRAIGEAHGRG
jgi:predicted RNA binding protein YcfA (HicA-like mRNA interferase family)